MIQLVEGVDGLVLKGDCINILKELESNSVDCLVTSPPYWALRDYGVAGQLGLEPTFQEYITKLCDIFDEVKRVLKDEGTCWVNIGDTYSSNFKGGTMKMGNPEFNKNRPCREATILPPKKSQLPDKSLCCIPDRFKIEMINRGWICRNEIIWYKPNCMPSSVKDRFTVDYEKVFFFVKQKKYFFKTQYEPHKNPQDVKYRQDLRKDKVYDVKEPYKNNVPYSVQPRTKEIVEYRNLPELKEFSLWLNNSRKLAKLTIDEIEDLHKSQAPHHWFNSESFPPKEDYLWLKEKLNLDNKYDEQMLNVFEKSSEKTTSEQGRNKRCVWQVTTKPFKEAHFATYPEKLIEPMIDAGCPVGGVVLDPFFGAGTTGVVALKQNKKYIGIELNEEYIKIANARLNSKEQKIDWNKVDFSKELKIDVLNSKGQKICESNKDCHNCELKDCGCRE